MAKTLFKEFADLKALEAQKAQVLSIFNEIKSNIKTLASVGVKLQGATSIKELSNAQKDYNTYIKDTDRLKKQLLDSEKKLFESERQYAKIIAGNRAELQKTNAELKAQAQFEQAAVGSRDRATAAVKKLTLERNKLNQFNEAEKKQYDELNAKIEKYNRFLKNTGTELEKQKLNVGNYAGSLAKPFESLQRELARLKSSNLSSLPGGSVGNSEAAGRSTQISELDKVLVKANREGITATQQVKLLETAFQKLSLAANPADKEMQKFLNNFKKEVGEAKDAVQDLKDEIKLNASDTQGLDNVVSVTNTLVGTAQLAVSTYQLLGGSQEDVQKSIANLIALQGIANSVQNLGQELTKKGTVVNKAYAFTQNLVATAFDKSAAASKRFYAALGIIGLIATVIGGIVVALGQMNKALSDTEKRQKIFNDLQKETASEVQKAIVEVAQMGNAFKQAKEGVISKELALKQYNEGIGKTIGQVNSLDEAERKYTEFAGTYIEYQKLKALANTSLAESARLQFEIELKRQEQTELGFFETVNAFRNSLTFFQKIKQAANVRDADLIQAELKAQQEGIVKKRNSEIKDLENRLNVVNNILSKASSDADALAKKNKFTNPDQIGLDKEAEDKRKAAQKKADEEAKRAAEERLKNQLELEKRNAAALSKIYLDNLNERIRINQLIVDSDNTALNQKLTALKNIRDIQATIALDEYQKAIEAEKSIANGKIEIKKKTANEILAAENELAIKLKVLDENLVKDREKTQQSYFEFIKSKYPEVYSEIYNTIKSFTDKFYEEEAKKKQKQIEDDERNATKKKELQKQLYSELSSLLTSFVTSQIAKEQEALDERIKNIDAQKQKEIEAINASGLSQDEKIKRIAQSEKQAAFDQEQLERRKRQLSVQRARFEKAANIAAIIQETALAVIRALGAKPYTPANISLAAITGAIGAAQLAKAISTPIPQFAKGTQNAPKGPAIVSEEGNELVREKSGRVYLTPSKPTLLDLKGGEKIYPANITRDILNSVNITALASMPKKEKIRDVEINNHLTKQMLKELRLISSKKEKINIIVEGSPYYNHNIKK